MFSRLPKDRTLEREDRWKTKYSPPVPNLLHTQQALVLLYAKVAGRPGTESYPAPSPSPTTQFLDRPLTYWCMLLHIWAPPSEFVSSSIPWWQTLTAHAQPFRGAMDLAFCLKVPLDSLLVWASSEGSGETARMRRLAWTFTARIDYKYQIRLTRSIYGSYILLLVGRHHVLWFSNKTLYLSSCTI